LGAIIGLPAGSGERKRTVPREVGCRLQALTVIASALGPLVLAETVSRTGSYASIFYLLAVVVAVLALLAWFVNTPLQSKSA